MIRASGPFNPFKIGVYCEVGSGRAKRRIGKIINVQTLKAGAGNQLPDDLHTATVALLEPIVKRAGV